VLGIKPQFDGLMIDPCLPSHLKQVNIHREFRGNRYEISIRNLTSGEKGRVMVAVDGKAIEGQTIPVMGQTGKVYQVEVTVG